QEEVVVELRLAFEQVQPKPTPAAPLSGYHPVAATRRNIDFGGDLVRAIEDARRVADRYAGHHARISEVGHARNSARPRGDRSGKLRVIKRKHIVLLRLLQK